MNFFEFHIGKQPQDRITGSKSAPIRTSQPLGAEEDCIGRGLCLRSAADRRGIWRVIVCFYRLQLTFPYSAAVSLTAQCLEFRHRHTRCWDHAKNILKIQKISSRGSWCIECAWGSYHTHRVQRQMSWVTLGLCPRPRLKTEFLKNLPVASGGQGRCPWNLLKGLSPLRIPVFAHCPIMQFMIQ